MFLSLPVETKEDKSIKTNIVFSLNATMINNVQGIKTKESINNKSQGRHKAMNIIFI